MSKTVLLAAVAALGILLMPSYVDAYGAARVNYTRVGPGGGVYHSSATVAGGYGGYDRGYYGGRTTGYYKEGSGGYGYPAGALASQGYDTGGTYGYIR
jgi:hypothetical protein